LQIKGQNSRKPRKEKVIYAFKKQKIFEPSIDDYHFSDKKSEVQDQEYNAEFEKRYV
jgi:hypothetical protein